MKFSQGVTEDGVQIGNHYNKYETRNFIAQYLMRNFTKSLDDLVKLTGKRTIFEVGCGEGFWSLRWLNQGFQIKACDFSEAAIAMAMSNAVEMNLDASVFYTQSIYELDEHNKTDLIVCCEVLEHLENPELALTKLSNIAHPWLIVSVPREPIWSWLNMARGKYLSDFGNTPGHIQRWSQSEFIDMVGRYFDVVEVRAPLPWTMLLCKARN